MFFCFFFFLGGGGGDVECFFFFFFFFWGGGGMCVFIFLWGMVRKIGGLWEFVSFTTHDDNDMLHELRLSLENLRICLCLLPRTVHDMATVPGAFLNRKAT